MYLDAFSLQKIDNSCFFIHLYIAIKVKNYVQHEKSTIFSELFLHCA